MINSTANNMITDMNYPVFNENTPPETDVSVFNTEYRIIQKIKRTTAEMFAIHQDLYRLMMQEILTTANGVIAYDFDLELLLNHLRAYQPAPENRDFIPMTMIAWKNLSGNVICSVEPIFLKWDSSFPLEDNLAANAYLEDPGQLVLKLSRQQYYPRGVIGKGDYVRTLRKIFQEQLGYTLI